MHPPDPRAPAARRLRLLIVACGLLLLLAACGLEDAPTEIPERDDPPPETSEPPSNDDDGAPPEGGGSDGPSGDGSDGSGDADEPAGEPDADAKVVTFPAHPDEETSAQFTVTVAGEAVPVYRHGSIHYAHFELGGRATVRAAADQAPGSYTLSPQSRGYEARTDGEALELAMEPGDDVAFHHFEGLDAKLFLFADAVTETPEASDGGVVSVLDHGADPEGDADASGAIEGAIEAAGSGGVVLVPPGTYRVENSIDLQSGVTLYLAGGALLQMGDVHDWAYMIRMENGSDMTLAGRGTIDANGLDQRARYDLDSFAPVRMGDCEGCEVRGVVLRNSPRDHINVKGSPHARVEDVKILTDAPFANTDGLHFGDGSNHARATDLFVYATDDPLTVGYRSNIEDVAITDAVLWNARSGAAFRITTRVDSGIDYVRDVRLENIDSIDSPRLIHLQPTGGGVVEGLVFSDIRAEDVDGNLFEIHNDPWGADTDRHGTVRNVRFEDVRVDADGASLIYSVDAAHPMEDVTFDGLVIEGDEVSTAEEANFEVGDHVVDLQF